MRLLNVFCNGAVNSDVPDSFTFESVLFTPASGTTPAASAGTTSCSESPLGVPRLFGVSVQQPAALHSGPESPDATCQAVKRLFSPEARAKLRPLT